MIRSININIIIRGVINQVPQCVRRVALDESVYANILTFVSRKSSQHVQTDRTGVVWIVVSTCHTKSY